MKRRLGGPPAATAGGYAGEISQTKMPRPYIAAYSRSRNRDSGLLAMAPGRAGRVTISRSLTSVRGRGALAGPLNVCQSGLNAAGGAMGGGGPAGRRGKL